MSITSQIFVQTNAAETRVALVGGDRLQELYVEDALDRGLLGNIYKGKVARVIPGMEAAFIDLGEEKNGFLPARELISRSSEQTASKQKPSITSLLHEGQNSLVQVIKESVGDKGPQLSGNLSLPTRNLVYLPYARPSGVAVSKKITEPALRDRLKWMIEEAIEEKGGEAASLGSVIVRTNAANASVTELTSELEFLLSRQATLQQQSAASNAPALLLEELPLHLRVLRDWLPDRVEEVVFDDAHQYQSALEFAQRYFPDQRQHLRMTERNDAARWQTIERSIRQALDRVVTLSNGANLVFDYTAAMTVVDVNTASYLGDKNQQHTVLQTNLEAAQVLAQQIRLRNIGGIIIVDFIDMESVSDRRKLLQALQAELEHDPNPSSCAAKSDLGLIEISRQRGRASLMQSFQQACYCCKGTGWVRSPRAVSLDVINELSELAESAAATSFTVKAPPPIIDYLSTRLSSAVQKLRDEFEVSIDLEEYGEVSESPYHIQLG